MGLFLNKEKPNIKKSKKKLAHYFSWRSRHNLDDIFKIDFEETDKNYPKTYLYSQNINGIPILVSKCDFLDKKTSFKNLDIAMAEKYLINNWEIIQNVILPAVSVKEKRKIDSVIQIGNFCKFSFFGSMSKLKKFKGINKELKSDIYFGIINKQILINCPTSA